MVLRIFLRVIQRSLHAHSPGAAPLDPASVRIGAVAFIHRFGSSLNRHVHFHVCVIDGVFEAGEGTRFHPASRLDEAAIEQAQAEVRRRVLRAFVSRGLIEKFDAQGMLAYPHSGFSVDAGVCIAPTDRAGLERLLRYCARPPFAMDRLRQRGAELVYHCPKPQAGGKRCDLVLTPLELIDRIAALVPPPRTHRHRYFGVLAPNSPLRPACQPCQYAFAFQPGDGRGVDAPRDQLAQPRHASSLEVGFGKIALRGGTLGLH